MIITTGGRTDEVNLGKARALAAKYNHPYIERNKKSIDVLFDIYETDIIVAGREKLTLFPLSTKKPIYFHPSIGMLRAKRILTGENDTFIEAAGIKENMSVLDCTMGLAADSTIASLTVKKGGKITAIEANPLLYILVTEGLKIYQSNVTEIDKAMRRIKTVHANHTDYLKTLSDNSFDIIYFDPMFQETITASSAIRKINEQTVKAGLTLETIKEAKRVAKQRIVLKDHWKSKRFEKLGFEQMKRKTSQVNYGYIEINNN